MAEGNQKCPERRRGRRNIAEKTPEEGTDSHWFIYLFKSECVCYRFWNSRVCLGFVAVPSRTLTATVADTPFPEAKISGMDLKGSANKSREAKSGYTPDNVTRSPNSNHFSAHKADHN